MRDTPDRRRVLVFGDPGLDDALALCWLLAQADVELVGVVAVAGNVEAAQAARNAGWVLGACGASARVWTSDHLPQAAARPLAAVHGHDGLGDLHEELAGGDGNVSLARFDPTAPPESDEWLILAPASVPMLVPASLRPGSITWMGGVCRGEGNSKGGGECNASADLEASGALCATAVSIVPLDATRTVAWSSPEDVPSLGTALEGAALGSTFTRLGRRYQELAQRRGRVARPHDLVAAQVWHDPGGAVWSPVRLEGERLEADPRAPARGALSWVGDRESVALCGQALAEGPEGADPS